MIKRTLLITGVVLLAFVAVFAVTQQGRADTDAPINIKDDFFVDEHRNRDVHYRMFMLKSLQKAAPVIIYSHGLGGDVNDAEYLASAMARKGYVVFYLQHEGSDSHIWDGLSLLEQKADIRRALRYATRDPYNTVYRFQDLTFFINKLIELNESRAMRKTMDLNRIAMIGQGYGTQGVFAAAGMKYKDYSFADPRVRVGIVISPSVMESKAKKSEAALKELFQDIKIPMLHITGTKDEHPYIGAAFKPEERALPYKYISAPEQYLMILDGADHGTFASNLIHKSNNLTDIELQEKVLEAITLFLQSYFEGDEVAYSNLRAGMNRTLSPTDHFEYK